MHRSSEESGQPNQLEQRKQFEQSFEALYPGITRWVKTHGWIEIGEDEYSRSFVRALDIGGMVWEGQEQNEYATMDEMLHELEERLAEWMREQWGEEEL